MIGVCVQETDRGIVAEFFELFKTPWEFWREGVTYDVLLCGESCEPPTTAPLVILSGSGQRPDEPTGWGSGGPAERLTWLASPHGPFPIYTGCRTFRDATDPVVLTREGAAAGIRIAGERKTTLRLGYNLFGEIRHLLTTGQPPAQAAVPTLDRHIETLRTLIVSNGCRLVEIPPVPVGHPFTVCLSHDVDHVGIRNHKADHTLLGFLARATTGSVIDALRGRLEPRHVLTNWAAAASLPLVHLGLLKDFWYQFDQYLALEDGRKSTFFIIPRPGQPGVATPGKSGPAPAARAARYDATTLGPYVDRLQAAGCEIGLHGIDAWCDPGRGRDEAAVIASLTGPGELGVRMHWLYFDADSPARLEAAGFSYDSTSGYNEAVGWRAGTTQVYRPPGVDRLLELPLHVMDTALFYPSRMNLAPKPAWDAVAAVADHTEHAGGVLTVNWHDRSLAPERLWGGFYQKLMDHLQSRGAWFATATETVAWFRHRRATQLTHVHWDADSIHVTASLPPATKLPGLRLRLHQPGQAPIDLPLQSEVRVRGEG
jgi:hypothetical protein